MSIESAARRQLYQFHTGHKYECELVQKSEEERSETEPIAKVEYLKAKGYMGCWQTNRSRLTTTLSATHIMFKNGERHPFHIG